LPWIESPRGLWCLPSEMADIWGREGGVDKDVGMGEGGAICWIGVTVVLTQIQFKQKNHYHHSISLLLSLSFSHSFSLYLSKCYSLECTLLDLAVLSKHQFFVRMGLLFLLSLVTFPTSTVVASVTCGECVWGERTCEGERVCAGCVWREGCV
jgi:hypothetical protein